MRIRNNRRKFWRILQIQKGILRSRRYPHNIPRKNDRTLEYSTPAWLDDIIVVTRGDRKEHEKFFYDILGKLEKAGYRASKRKSELFLNKIK